jgi:FHA domain
MAVPVLLQFGSPAGTGSTAVAFGLALWACLVGLSVVRLVLVGAPCPHAWARLRRPPSARRVSPRRLERQVLRAVIRAAVLDTRGTRLLPDRVEVLLAPGELRALGPLADQIAENIAHGMVTLVRESSYRLASDPSVILTAANPTRRPAIRTHFERPATTLQDASYPRLLRLGHPLDVTAVLRRLEPPGRPLLLRSRHVRLGRRPECDLTIPEPAVSRRHASLHWRVGGWYLLDHGSTNGTFVNGSRLEAPTRLADGDEIHLGRRVRLRFERSHLRGG